MIIETSAPTRVDLAGGTIDIWPLYLFHERAVTVNLAVDLAAHCKVVLRSDGRFILRSIDTGEAAEFDGLAPLRTTPTLKLLARLIYFFSPGSGLEMVTDCTAPPGSGLAGSSALNIAICSALNQLAGSRFSQKDLIRIARNVEAQVIEVPTGEQDYYPAAYGGLQAIHFSPSGVQREVIRVDLDRLSQRLILVYSGRQRNSGINNWDVMKRHIDGDPIVYRAFEGIIAAANRTLDALRRGAFDEIDDALAEEWTNRRRLSAGITTPEIDEIVALATSFGARSAKVCGAGGGGCVVLSVPEGRRQEIQDKLRERRVQVIDYRIARQGVCLSAESPGVA
ncbi:MAG: GHMP kinase [Acidobacteriota bacterium]|jgi:D-glycero-alpha-D-manno-heptose-7-phosphate kinase